MVEKRFKAHVWLPEGKLWWEAEIPAIGENDAVTLLQEFAYAWGGIRGKNYVFAVREAT
jgi:hypothetical protein